MLLRVLTGTWFCSPHRLSAIVATTGEKSPLHSFTGLQEKPSNAGNQLFRKAIEILSDFGRSHRIVQGFAHQRQHVVKVAWQVLFSPVTLPAFGQTEEHVNRPAIRVRSALAAQVFEQGR